MITAIEIENFKGIAARQRIELKPLTLLFGANSAGKSTLLHALHYAREVFERHNLDADQTMAGGRFVDLGGFRNFIHRSSKPKSPASNDLGDGDDSGYGGAGDGSGTGVGTGYGTGLPDGSGFGDPYSPGDGSERSLMSRPVRLRFELTLGPHEHELPEYLPRGTRQEGSFPVSDLIWWGVRGASVEIEIAWSELLSAPYVASYSVEINSVPLATIEANVGRRSVEIARLNWKHPVASLSDRLPEDPREEDESVKLSFLEQWFESFAGELPAGDLTWPIIGATDALPAWESLLRLEPREGQEADADSSKRDWLSLVEMLTILIVGPGELVRDWLRGMRYVGPLRETPAREYAPPRFPDPSRWAGGLGAWDLLQTGPEELVDDVSRWLSDPERLNAGYELARKGVAELDTADPLVRKLLSGRLFDEAEEGLLDLNRLVMRRRLVIRPVGSDLELRPHDIGIGISQVVPVVVTALDGRDKLIAIEQPELHLHPRLQAELGDLFIASALGERKHRVLLETHSELIPLRVMRRIRDSLEGQLPSHCPAISSNDVAIYYVCVVDGTSRFRQLELGDDGSMLDPWPGGFFEEGFRERFGNGGAVQ